MSPEAQKAQRAFRASKGNCPELWSPTRPKARQIGCAREHGISHDAFTTLHYEIGGGAAKYDLRPTAITGLLANPSVPERMVIEIAGHVSNRMPERYSHQRKAAKQAALNALDTLSENKGEGSGACTSPFELMGKPKKAG